MLVPLERAASGAQSEPGSWASLERVFGQQLRRRASRTGQPEFGVDIDYVNR